MARDSSVSFVSTELRFRQTAIHTSSFVPPRPSFLHNIVVSTEISVATFFATTEANCPMAARVALPHSFLESALSTRADYEASLLLPDEERLALEQQAVVAFRQAVVASCSYTTRIPLPKGGPGASHLSRVRRASAC